MNPFQFQKLKNSQLIKQLSIKSNPVLIALAVGSIIVMTCIEKNMETRWSSDASLKEEAMSVMAQCIGHLTKHAEETDIPIDPVNDPNGTGMIGPRYSEITSGRGAHPSKLATTNSSSAALLVHLLKEANVKEGDMIAVGQTGSFPGLNIALSVAADVMKVELVSIASVTSSSWGATNPNYTWLDMHAILKQSGLITSNILGASIGANQDIGRSLSPVGRSSALHAIHRNDLRPIVNGSLEENISERIKLFSTNSLKKKKAISLYVNIGGGIASLGSRANSTFLPHGLLSAKNIHELPDRKGLVYEFSERGIQTLNLKNIEQLYSEYNVMNDSPEDSLEESHLLFAEVKYKVPLVWASLLLLVSSIAFIIIVENRRNALGSNIVSISKS